jgi:hypothetical protein
VGAAPGGDSTAVGGLLLLLRLLQIERSSEMKGRRRQRRIKDYLWTQRRAERIDEEIKEREEALVTGGIPTRDRRGTLQSRVGIPSRTKGHCQ